VGTPEVASHLIHNILRCREKCGENSPDANVARLGLLRPRVSASERVVDLVLVVSAAKETAVARRLLRYAEVQGQQPLHVSSGS
jgi:hypothetical protein